MGLLQDPLKALEQVEWYLDHQNEEYLPGAFELAAGNLCRQTLEQILFILCFFSTMPTNRYFKTDRTLHTAGQLLKELDKKDPASGKKYWELARLKGTRIRKFAKQPRQLKIWQRRLNESSHFSVKYRKLDEKLLRIFLRWIRLFFDELDKYLITAIINELLSNGKVTATLSNDINNTPGVFCKVIVRPRDIELNEQGVLALRSPEVPITVISDSTIPRGRWPRTVVLVQHTAGMSIGLQLLTKQGNPIDIRTGETILLSFSKTRGQKAAITRRLKQLGLKIKWGHQKSNL